MRLFTVATSPARQEQRDIPPATWQRSNSTTVGPFSVVCFQAAQRLIDMRLGNRPVGLVLSAVGGTRVEAWMSSQALQVCVAQGHTLLPGAGDNAPTELWNGMVAPLKALPVRAVLWYQGKANADQAEAMQHSEAERIAYYRCFLGAMIADWRRKKGAPTLPFVYMQLTPSVSPATPAGTPPTGREEITDAMVELLPAVNSTSRNITGMAVGIDLGGRSAWGFNHTPDKNEVSVGASVARTCAAYVRVCANCVGAQMIFARCTNCPSSARYGRLLPLTSIPIVDVMPFQVAWRMALQVWHTAYAQPGIARSPNRASLWTGPLLEHVVAAHGAVIITTGDIAVRLKAFSAHNLALKEVFNCTSCCQTSPFQIYNGTNWLSVAPRSLANSTIILAVPASIKGIPPTPLSTAALQRCGMHGRTLCNVYSSTTTLYRWHLLHCLWSGTSRKQLPSWSPRRILAILNRH